MAARSALVIVLSLPWIAAAGCSKTRASTIPGTQAQARPASLPDEYPGKKRQLEAEAALAAEKSGTGQRWKDTGVYLDGKPIGMLQFGELPISLRPVWVKDRISAPKRPGTNDPGWRWAQQRNYRFTDYLRAAGVDLSTVKEIHVYGPQLANSIVVSGQELRRRGAEFYFRFGGIVGGKTIPVVPPHFGNDVGPDKISAVMVYAHKRPPKLVYNEGFELAGKIVEDVPYFGEPIRGGVRIYRDDRLVTIIKRKLLSGTPNLLAPSADGKVHWKLGAVLAAQGVDLKGVAEAWVIRDERRKERLSPKDLAALTFQASDGGRGEIYLGEKKTAAQALALHSRPLRADELPQILPDEE